MLWREINHEGKRLFETKKKYQYILLCALNSHWVSKYNASILLVCGIPKQVPEIPLVKKCNMSSTIQ